MERFPAPSEEMMRAPDGRPWRLRNLQTTPTKNVTARSTAFEELLPLFGLDVEGPPTSAEEIFERSAPVYLEIGSGAGEAAIASALAEPGVDLIAADVHTPGIAGFSLIFARMNSPTFGFHGDALEFITRLPAPFAEIGCGFLTRGQNL